MILGYLLGFLFGCFLQWLLFFWRDANGQLMSVKFFKFCWNCFLLMLLALWKWLIKLGQ